MDILTQSLLGATVAQSVARKVDVRLATLIGLVSGVIADADVLIRSSSDPLLSLEYHRHFTHSLFFIPFGALLAFLLFWPFLRSRLSAGYLYLYCFMGYLLSGFIDACTSYGTHLLWPLSDERVSWNIVSIVDPVFTGLLIVGVLFGFRKKSAVFSRVALILAGSYLLFATLQSNRAEQSVSELAKQRGHQIERMVVKPTFGNTVLWRSVYLADDTFYIDAIRTGVKKQIYRGAAIEKIVYKELFPDLEKDSVLFKDIMRFDHFSDGYVIEYPGNPQILGDVRYSMNPLSAVPLWGIRMNREDFGQHVTFESFRVVSKEAKQQFVDMLLGRETN